MSLLHVLLGGRAPYLGLRPRHSAELGRRGKTAILEGRAFGSMRDMLGNGAVRHVVWRGWADNWPR